MELKRIIKILTLVSGLLLPFQFFLGAQMVQQDSISIEQDSLKAMEMLTLAGELKNSQQYDIAMAVLESTLKIAVEQRFEEIEADSYYMLGEIYDWFFNNWELTLMYYLKARDIYESLNMDTRVAGIYSFLASKYYDFGVFNKSAEYYIKQYNLYESGVPGNMITTSYNAAISYFRDNLYKEAISWFRKSEELAIGKGDTASVINSLFGLTACGLGLDNYSDTRLCIEQLIDLLEPADKSISLAEAYNSMALVCFEQRDYPAAIDYYLQSAKVLGECGEGANEEYTNVAICYQNMDNGEMTTIYFEKALDEAKKYNDKSGQARLEHILAVVSKNREDYYHAGYYCNAAIESAKISSNFQVLQESYLTYSDVLEEGNDFVKALEYYEKYLSLRDSLLLEERLAEQADKRRRTDLENLEQQMLLSLADEELKDVMIDKLRVENEKRENELQLIERERELERSERERLEQSIALARERHNREMQQQEIRNLEQERAIQRLELLRQENEEKELLRKNQLQESEIRQQQLEIDKEHEARKRAIWMAVLLGIIVILIMGSFISSRRKNIILSEQKNEISAQKDIIEERNRSITDSIEYASRIQTAVLPSLNFFDEWKLENFILFKPKDIVSGDFYWGQKKDHMFCFAAADCTGHGVPGAFMSMLGNAYLNDIINSRKYNNAGNVLNQLREEVIKSLKQRGEEGETQDGMDIALCLYNKQANTLDFAGANNPVYLIRDNEITRIDADKMPIGIHRSSDKPFTNHCLKLQAGDIIYLFSDGYVDQFGGPVGKKFKYRAFREMLLQEHKKPMHEQKEMLEKAFVEWKGEIEQVDDVLVMGVKFDNIG